MFVGIRILLLVLEFWTDVTRFLQIYNFLPNPEVHADF
jgi:hypothetical protein